MAGGRWQMANRVLAKPDLITARFEGRFESLADLREGGVEDLDKEIRVRQAQAHRGLDTDCLAPQTSLADEQAQVARKFEDAGAFGLGGLFGLTVFDQFDADHQAATADVAEQSMLLLQLFQAGE